jgi:hypothetical protein
MPARNTAPTGRHVLSKFRAEFHHKVSPTCKCGHARARHAGLQNEGACGGISWRAGDSDELAVGRTTTCAHDCTKFENGDIRDVMLPKAVIIGGDMRSVAGLLRSTGILQPGQGLIRTTLHMQQDGGRYVGFSPMRFTRLVCIPKRGIWHSIVLTEVEQPEERTA